MRYLSLFELLTTAGARKSRGTRQAFPRSRRGAFATGRKKWGEPPTQTRRPIRVSSIRRPAAGWAQVFACIERRVRCASAFQSARQATSRAALTLVAVLAAEKNQLDAWEINRKSLATCRAPEAPLPGAVPLAKGATVGIEDDLGWSGVAFCWAERRTTGG